MNRKKAERRWELGEKIAGRWNPPYRLVTGQGVVAGKASTRDEARTVKNCYQLNSGEDGPLSIQAKQEGYIDGRVVYFKVRWMTGKTKKIKREDV